MRDKRKPFDIGISQCTNEILRGSKLSKFVEKIKFNYSKNLREANCKIDFGLPDYEEIFLRMVFQVGLNGETESMIPIEQFGDGYVSMFVMAIIQSIAEHDPSEKCLFLFEEPESFLHENHQEYFYKSVLCRLSSQGHQVIYTTHSAKMLDIFDTKGIIRVEYCERSRCTVKRYNNTKDFDPKLATDELISVLNYNSFIKSVEPNLNRILFGKKVILVEGPNDLMSYNFAIEKKITSLSGDSEYAKSYLSFNDISIVVHHGKSTAILLIELCNHFGISCYVISDWDLEYEFFDALSKIESLEELKQSPLYLAGETGIPRKPQEKASTVINWKLLHSVAAGRIHFNVPRLEASIGYERNDKSSLNIWRHLNSTSNFSRDFFPTSLENFLEFRSIHPSASSSNMSDENSNT